MKVTASGLIVPEHIGTGDPTVDFPFVCRVCKRRWRSGGPAFERHVIRCAEENAEELHRANTANDEFFQPPDPELEGWVAGHREEILEGRKKFGTGG